MAHAELGLSLRGKDFNKLVGDLASIFGKKEGILNCKSWKLLFKSAKKPVEAVVIIPHAKACELEELMMGGIFPHVTWKCPGVFNPVIFNTIACFLHAYEENGDSGDSLSIIGNDGETYVFKFEYRHDIEMSTPFKNKKTCVEEIKTFTKTVPSNFSSRPIAMAMRGITMIP